MKTIEQLKTAQAAELAKLEKEHEIANGLPLAPLRVMVNGATRAPWVTYKRPTIAAAFDVFETFHDAGLTRPKVYRRNGCAVVEPLAIMDQKYKDADTTLTGDTDFGCFLNVQHGDGFGPDVDLIFFVELPALGYMRVCVDIEKERFDRNQWAKLRAVAREQRGYGGALVSRTFAPNAALNGYADKVITWASGDTGPIKHGANHTYLFVDDFGHISGQFANMAAEFDPATQEA